MMIPFWKMHGAGNDFIILHNKQEETFTPAQIQAWCRRHTGIGADGLIMITPPTQPEHHFSMQFFNPDGQSAAMCGNGARCVARFAYDQNMAPSHMQFETEAGSIQAEVNADTVTLKMQVPKITVLDREIQLSIGRTNVDIIDSGVPHAILLCQDLCKLDIQKIGAEIRYHLQFAPHGTNVDFVQVKADRSLKIRTYERGVEAETLACGTGVVAAATICFLKKLVQSPVRVETHGGDQLTVRIETMQEQIHDVKLTGPAMHVFHGFINDLSNTESMTC